MEFEKALSKNNGKICWLSRSSLLLDKLSMYKLDGDGLRVTGVGYRPSNTSNMITRLTREYM